MKHTFSIRFSVFKVKQYGYNAPELLHYGYISPVCILNIQHWSPG